jgi:predicted DNA-binding transcriptional regulator YafY
VEYSDGGLYLRAYVPEYDEVRMFAVERIKSIRITEQSFTPVKAVSDEDFEPSLGLGNGKPERVVLEFSARVAPYVRERVWHKSQQLDELPDGALRLTLKVSRDWALHGWVLSWGPHARVITPSTLAEEILVMLDDAREFYVPRLQFDPVFNPVASSVAPSLPLRGNARPGKRRSASPS